MMSSIEKSKNMYMTSTYSYLKRILASYCDNDVLRSAFKLCKKAEDNVFITILKKNILTPQQFRMLMGDNEVFTYRLLLGERWFKDSTLQYLFDQKLLLDSSLFSSFKSFQNVVYKLYSLRGQMKSLNIFKLYEKELLQSFKKNGLVWVLFLDTDCFVQVLRKKLYTFKELVDLCIDQQFFRTFLTNKAIVSKCESKGLLNFDDYKYLHQKIFECNEVASLSYNKVLNAQFVDKQIESFENLLLSFKKVNKLNVFLSDCTMKTEEDAIHALKMIDSTNEFMTFSQNVKAVQFSLENFLIDSSILSKLSKFAEKAYEVTYGTLIGYTDFFSYWKRNLKNEKIVEFCELNQLLEEFHTFNSSQKKEISTLIQSSSSSKSILQKIVSGNLQDQYTFQTLYKILVKDENKKKCFLNL